MNAEAIAKTQLRDTFGPENDQFIWLFEWGNTSDNCGVYTEPKYQRGFVKDVIDNGFHHNPKFNATVLEAYR